MPNGQEESLQDLNMKVPPEWHTVIKVASARIGIPIRAFLLMCAAHMLDSISSDPVIRSVMPTKKAWPESSAEKFQVFRASASRPDEVICSPRNTAAVPDESEGEIITTVATTFPDRVAQLVERQVEQGKSIARIAAEVGYDTPRLLEMFLDGRVKLPLDKAHTLARALGIHSAALFRDTLRQYWPADDETLDAVLGEPVTDQEREILRRIRTLHSEKADGNT